jgi:hypothetical protein
MPASFATLRIMAPEHLCCFASSNVEPAHNTTKYFVPTHSEVVNLTGLLKTKD